METTNINLLRQQIPTTILSDIDAAEDQQIIERYREAKDRGENPDDSEYIAALRRCARMIGEKIKAALKADGGYHHSTPEIVAEISARLDAGRARCAAAARTRQAAIGPKPETEPPEAASQLSVCRPSVERPELSDEDISKLSNEELDRLIQEEESRE